MSPPSDAEVKQSRFGYIDELRGIAVLLVISVHIGYYANEHLVVAQISRYGQYGVQLFFLLSAFTLCHSMSRVTVLTGREYEAFFIKRFFRIAPLYYAAAIFYGVYTLLSSHFFGKTPWTEPGDYSLASVLSNVFLVHGLSPPGVNSVVPGGWSIGCEFLFYALFPLVFFASRKRVWLLWAMVPASIAISVAMPPFLEFVGWKEPISYDSFYYYFIANQWPCFMLGMLYYHLRREAWFIRSMIIMAPFAAITLAFLHHSMRWWMLTPTVAAIFFVGLTLILERIRRTGWLAKIGECSFSIYLVHFVVVWSTCVLCLRKMPWILENNLPVVLLYGGISAVTYVISRWSYLHIESRFVATGRRFSDQIKSR